MDNSPMDRLLLAHSERTFGREFTSVDQLRAWKIRNGYEQIRGPQGYVLLPDPVTGERIRFPTFEYTLLRKIGTYLMRNGKTYWSSVKEAIEQREFFELGTVSPGGYDSLSSLDCGRQWHVTSVMLDYNMYEIAKDALPDALMQFPKLFTLEVDSPPITRNNPVLQELVATGVTVDIHNKHGCRVDTLQGK